MYWKKLESMKDVFDSLNKGLKVFPDTNDVNFYFKDENGLICLHSDGHIIYNVSLENGPFRRYYLKNSNELIMREGELYRTAGDFKVVCLYKQNNMFYVIAVGNPRVSNGYEVDIHGKAGEESSIFDILGYWN